MSIATITALDLIKSSLRIIGVLRKGEPMDADEAEEALQGLNLLLMQYSAQRLMLLAGVMKSFVLTANKESYTIGTTGADITDSRPIKILDGYIRDSTARTDTTLSIITKEQYNAYGDKSFTAASPETVCYDPGESQQSTSLGTFFFYPMPEAADTAYLNLQKRLTEIATLDEILTFDPVYLRMIKYNFAVEIYPEYWSEGNHPIPTLTLKLARESKAVVEAMNATRVMADMDLPGMAGGRYNIYIDT